MREVVFIGLLMAVPAIACAEGGTCPPGYYPHNIPGVMGCAPIPGYDANQQPRAPEPEGPPVYVPIGTWTVIAIDAKARRAGVSIAEPKKRVAKKVAKQQCGTENCKVELVEYLGCGALAWGDVGYGSRA